MYMHVRSSVFASLAVLLVGFSLLFFSAEAKDAAAPNWSLKDLDGKTVKLSDFKGQVLILNFWATWCPPCVAEIPDFIEVEKEYHGKGVAVVGISIDSIQPSEVAAFAKKRGINYPVLMSTDEVAAAYGADQAVPITVVIKPDGTIADKQQGMVSKSYLENQIAKLLPAAASH
jgi:cytochrome c biogenesis protein CcmG/thiol:disulfide interchange protein DsbE